jgi:hypothetical protein
MWVPQCDVTLWQRIIIAVFDISIYIYLGPEIEPPLALSLLPQSHTLSVVPAFPALSRRQPTTPPSGVLERVSAAPSAFSCDRERSRGVRGCAHRRQGRAEVTGIGWRRRYGGSSVCNSWYASWRRQGSGERRRASGLAAARLLLTLLASEPRSRTAPFSRAPRGLLLPRSAASSGRRGSSSNRCGGGAGPPAGEALHSRSLPLSLQSLPDLFPFGATTVPEEGSAPRPFMEAGGVMAVGKEGEGAVTGGEGGDGCGVGCGELREWGRKGRGRRQEVKRAACRGGPGGAGWDAAAASAGWGYDVTR